MAAISALLHEQAFETSLQPNIVSIVSTGKIIAVNKAACKLLGYSKKELLTKTRSLLFDINESSFKKMLKQKTTKRHVIAYMTVVQKSGKRIPCEITSAVFNDENEIGNAITTITDLSGSQQKQKKLDAKREKIVAFNIGVAKSKQRGIDVKNKKIVTDNIGIARSKQKNIDSKNKKTVAGNIILAKSKQRGIDIKNRKVVADNIGIAKSKQKNIDSKNKKIVDNNISIAKSKQRGIDAANKVKWDHEFASNAKQSADYKESFKLIFNSSSDILYDIDLDSNKVVISDGYEKEFGYKTTTDMTPAEIWSSHIHDDDKDALINDYFRMLKSEDLEWKYNFRFIKADSSIANILGSNIVLRKIDNRAYRMIGSMHDISKQKKLEERLELEIKLKEKQITDAKEEAKDTERSDIGKELHDNVNQLLGASNLYLEMAKHGGEFSEMYLRRTSEYTQKAIEEIRKLTKGLTTDTIKHLGLSEAIDNIVRDTMEINAVKIFYDTASSIEDKVNDKFKLNVFRIVQEQLNNILKHAKATKINIRIAQNKKSIRLIIADNGIGFDTAVKRKGIGLDNIKSRAESFDGTAAFVSKPGHGCILTVTFPVSDTVSIKAL
ncbi:MAG: PAS domain S-box protein [Bacteroidota bacterium]